MLIGYDLHITRREFHADPEGPAITLKEWKQVVDADRELAFDSDVDEASHGRVAYFKEPAHALWWADGEICAKNPDTALIIKMVQIAASLRAHVEGDDGERYTPDGTVDQQPAPAAGPQPSLLQRFMQKFRRKTSARQKHDPAMSFAKGMRVRDAWGNRGIVTEIDREAMSGLGRVTIQYDDGRQASFACVASGLELDTGS